MITYNCDRNYMWYHGFMRIKRIGLLQKKLLILLVGIASAGLSYNPRQQMKILKQIGREWNKANDFALKRTINDLYKSKLIDIKDFNGFTKIVITKSGKTRALEFKIDELCINRPKTWDKKWRIIVFDIPEKYKKVREVVRSHLDRLGFYKLQKSVFVLPFECESETDFIIEYYNVRSYVRQILADKIDNELHLKNIFNI